MILPSGIARREAVAHAEVEILVGRHVAHLEVAHELSGHVVVNRIGGLRPFERVARLGVAKASAHRHVGVGLHLEGLEHEGRRQGSCP